MNQAITAPGELHGDLGESPSDLPVAPYIPANCAYSIDTRYLNIGNLAIHRVPQAVWAPPHHAPRLLQRLVNRGVIRREAEPGGSPGESRDA